jgi:hypothetical protein
MLLLPALGAFTFLSLASPRLVHASEESPDQPSKSGSLLLPSNGKNNSSSIRIEPNWEWSKGVETNIGLRNKDCDLALNPRSPACIGSTQGALPSNGLERLIMDTTQLGVSDGNQILSNPQDYFLNKTTKWAVSEATSAVNRQFKKIPFLAQTTIGMDQTTGAAGSFYLDSFMKLATLGHDSDGAAKGLIFSQARWTGAWGLSGSTINTGIGTRYRVGDDAMIGINGFWDYRMVQYTSSYSRFGIGVEGFWKDLEARNNWYISGTGTKIISDTPTTTTYERVVPGWDVELAYRFPQYPQLSVYVKGFLWDYVSRQDNSGIGGGVNWQATPNVNLEASVSNEVPAYLTYAPSNNNSNVYVSMKVKYTFNKVEFAPRQYKQNILTSMTQPVRRRYDVLLERYTANKISGSFAVQVSGS